MAKAKAKTSKKIPVKVTPAAKLLSDPVFALSALKAAVEGIATKNLTAKTLSATDISRHYIAVKNATEELEAVAKALGATRDELKGKIIPEVFESAGITSHNLAEGFRVGVASNVRTSIRPDGGSLTVYHLRGVNTKHIYATCLTPDFPMNTDTRSEPVSAEKKVYEGKEAAYWWLRCNQLGDLIVETVNAQTLAAAAKKRLEDGFDLPETHFNVAIMPTTSVTKIAGAKGK